MKTSRSFCFKFVLFILIGLTSMDVQAQHPSAIADFESTSQGLLAPRMTSAQRTAISSPAEALLVYDTDTQSFWYFDDTDWIELGAGALSDGLYGDGGSANPGDSISFDLPPVVSTITLSEAGVIDASTEIEVCIDIEHTWVGDLLISLKAPDGTTSIDLSSNNGTNGSNYTGTCFSDAGASSITAGSAPFTGTFMPEEALSAFIGQNIAGNWELTVIDDDSGANGNLLSWSIQIGGGDPIVANEIADGDGDTKIQVEESLDDDVIRFDIEGKEKLTLSRNDDGRLLIEPKDNFFNTMLGDRAGEVLLGTAYSNTLIGADAGRLLTTGVENTLVGTGAGAQVVNKNNNTMIGRWAGEKNTGAANTFIGGYSARNNLVGENNTYVGTSAGHSSTGSSNVFIGRSAGYNESGSQKLYIANTNTSSPLVYGEFDNKLLRFQSSLEMGQWNAGESGNGSTQLLLSGTHNDGVNDGSASGTYKLKIEGYNNEGTIVYPIHIMDENSQVDFYIKNRPNGLVGARPSMYFAGNVAIGQEKFATGYRFSVDGKIACEEVLVDLDGDWPDYVFKADYDLKTIAQIKTHIAEKGHLPGVPSAQEVEDNGIKVGEMNKILMEKVEELTLYIIQQDEQLKAQEARLQALENSK